MAARPRLRRVNDVPGAPRTSAPPPPAELLAGQPGLVAARVAPGELTRLPIDAGSGAAILLLDPRGNLVLRYGDDPDAERLAKDLQRLLRASQIG